MTVSAADAARHGVRPLLPGPVEALRDEVLRLGLGPGALGSLAAHGTVEAFAVRGLSPDQTRVIERELRRRGGEVLSAPAGDRALLLGPLQAFGELPGRLAEWGRATESVGGAIAAALAGTAAGRRTVRAGPRRLETGDRTLVMGIVNVTPDSFSGDGLGEDHAAAVALGAAMVEAGADLVDVGGESTRPGCEPVSAEVEAERAVPVVEALASRLEVPVSIDTRKARVAEQALSAGATVVNDIWGLRRDPQMAGVVAAGDCAAILVHNSASADHTDVVAEVCDGLRQSLALAEAAGIDADRLIVDPGIGFGKRPLHNLELVRRLGELRGLGRPILVGASRKSTIGLLLDAAPPDQRLEGSLALAVLAVRNGADLVRVHDVAETVSAVRVADAVVHAPPPGLADLPAPGRTG